MRVDYGFRRARRLSLTPLIDIIFLLLLFFMLSSTFSRFAEIEISASTGGASSSQPRPDILVRLDDEGLGINGQTVGDADVEATLADLTDAGAKSAVLLVRGEVDSQRLVSLLERMRRVRGLDITISK